MGGWGGREGGMYAHMYVCMYQLYHQSTISNGTHCSGWTHPTRPKTLSLSHLAIPIPVGM